MLAVAAWVAAVLVAAAEAAAAAVTAVVELAAAAMATAVMEVVEAFVAGPLEFEVGAVVEMGRTVKVMWAVMAVGS